MTELSVTCACGQVLTAALARAGRKIECPRCAKFATLPAAPPAASLGISRAAAGADVGALCSICQTAVSVGAPLRACDRCGIGYHEDCWVGYGGCATYGCERAPKTVKDPGATASGAGWGDEKSCPRCNRRIRSVALKCRYCAASFSTSDPLSRSEYRSDMAFQDERQRFVQTAAVFFGASLLGCLAPVIFPASLIWLIRSRKWLGRVAGVAPALAVAAVTLSFLHCVVLSFVFLVD